MTEPTLVYDDDCGFCTWWANWIDARSDVRLVGFSELDEESGAFDDLRDRLPDDFENCSHFVTDDDVYSCGASIEEALVRSDICQGVDLSGTVGFLRHFSDYNRFRERGYRFVADRRSLWGHVLSAPPPARHDEDGDQDG